MTSLSSRVVFSRRSLPNGLFRRFTSKDTSRTMRALKILKDDVKYGAKSLLGHEMKPRFEHPSYCDILIIGGGIMGSSIAYWLKQRALDGLSIVVVEKDISVMLKNEDFTKYRDSTSVLSVGGLRQQFSLKENIQLSLYSAEFLRDVSELLAVEGEDPVDIHFNPTGYLFLASDKSAHILEQNAALQQSLGAKVELLTPEKLKSKFPWMNTRDIAVACHGLENEGWFDPWSLLYGFKRKAISLGAHYVPGEVTKFHFKDTSRLTAVGSDLLQIDKVEIKTSSGKDIEISCGIAVLAAGPFSGEVGKLAGIGTGEGLLKAPIPVEPRKRYVYNVHCPGGPGLQLPMVIDPSGTYVRREGIRGNYLCGRSPLDDAEPPVDSLEVDYEFFEKEVWPVLASRIPSFENCKVQSAWAGYYDFNSFDENAIIGVHPAFANLFLATGFSGHGIQQAPAVGRAMMEIIVDGQYLSIDLSRLDFNRYIEEEPLWESNIV